MEHNKTLSLQEMNYILLEIYEQNDDTDSPLEFDIKVDSILNAAAEKENKRKNHWWDNIDTCDKTIKSETRLSQRRAEILDDLRILRSFVVLVLYTELLLFLIIAAVCGI